MVSVPSTLLHGFWICIPFTIFAVLSFWLRPRLWLHSLPSDISESVPKKTETEVRQTRILLVLYLLILPGLSLFSTYWLSRDIDLSLLGAFRHLYGIWLMVHLWDLIVIDGIHIWIIDPQQPPIPGTEGARGWTDFGFHFRSFLEASWKSLVFVVPASVLMATIL